MNQVVVATNSNTAVVRTAPYEHIANSKLTKLTHPAQFYPNQLVGAT